MSFDPFSHANVTNDGIGILEENDEVKRPSKILKYQTLKTINLTETGDSDSSSQKTFSDQDNWSIPSSDSLSDEDLNDHENNINQDINISKNQEKMDFD